MKSIVPWKFLLWGNTEEREVGVLCRRSMKVSAMKNVNRNPTRKNRTSSIRYCTSSIITSFTKIFAISKEWNPKRKKQIEWKISLFERSILGNFCDNDRQKYLDSTYILSLHRYFTKIYAIIINKGKRRKFESLIVQNFCAKESQFYHYYYFTKIFGTIERMKESNRIINIVRLESLILQKRQWLERVEWKKWNI